MRKLSLLLLALALAVAVAAPVLAAGLYSSDVTVSDNSSVDRTGVGTLVPYGTSQAVDFGYLTANGTDTRMFEGTTERRYMVASDRLGVLSPELLADQERIYRFETGYSPPNDFFGVIVGYGGYVTVDDEDVTLELGDNFTIEQSGWWDTSAGANKNAVSKVDAFRTYVSGTGNITSTIYAAISVDVQVVASTDDAMAYYDEDPPGWGALALTNANQEVGWSSVDYARMGGGMRFLNVTIPPGSVITTADLTFKANANNAVNTVKSYIRGEDTGNAATFSDYANYGGRSRTTANVTWDAIGAWTTDTDYTTPELKTIIQEITDRADWASGNAIVIFWDDHNDRSTHAGNCRRQAYSYDGSNSDCAKLHIEYFTTVTATGISSGEHTVRTSSSSAFLGIGIDVGDNTNFPAVSDNLVLNVPLWGNHLAGSPFYSVDANAHTCTVTGATWTTNGYSFDGVANHIDIPSIVLDKDNAAIEVWVYSTGDYSGEYAQNGLILGNTSTRAFRHLGLYDDDGVGDYLLVGETDANSEYFINTGAVSRNAWVCIQISFSAGTVTSYVNASFVDTETVANDVTFNLIGRGGESTPGSPFKGYVGEIRLYDRALTPDEVLENYNATKWKYIGTHTDDDFDYIYSSASVPDNANDWTFLRNNVMPYADNITVSVDGTRQLWFQPSYIIESTREEGSADGGSTTVLWDSILTQGDDYWDLARLIITSTTDGLAPEGETSVVTDFDAAGDNLTFGALTAAVGAGDNYTVAFATLVDREGSNDGRVTWGINQDLVVSVGGLQSLTDYESEATEESAPPTVLPLPGDVDMWGDETDVSVDWLPPDIVGPASIGTPVYDTGDATGVEGTDTITGGGGTAWDDSMDGYTIIIDGDIYVIESVDGPADITLTTDLEETYVAVSYVISTPSLGWSINTLYGVLMLFVAMGVGVGAAIATGSALLAAIAVAVGLVVAASTGAVGWWVVIVFSIFGASYLVAARSM